MNPPARMLWGLVALLVITVIGAIGYMAIEGWSLLDSFYMTIITITTVGYSEVYPLSEGGKIFSVFLIVGGVGTAFYTLLANPTVNEKIRSGDQLIVIGSRKNLFSMENTCEGVKSP